MDNLPDKLTIKNAISDSVSNLMYYDRKEDECMRVGTIEVAIAEGVISVDEMVEEFRRCVNKYINAN